MHRKTKPKKMPDNIRHTDPDSTPEEVIVELRRQLKVRDGMLAAMSRREEVSARQLAERDRQLAAAREQLASVTEYSSGLESRLELEAVGREGMVRAEVERMRPEMEARVRESVLSEYEGRSADLAAREEALARRETELERREAGLRREMEQMAERLVAQVRQRYEEEKEKALRGGVMRIREVQEITLEALKSAMDGDAERGAACVGRMRETAPVALGEMEAGLREALERAERLGGKQARQIAELVRMVFARKSERVELGEGERETLLEEVLKSVELTEAEKAERRECHRKIREYRERMRLAGALTGGERRGHGRKPIPDSMPRLVPITLWPEGYEGHEGEYRVIGKDMQEFILPVSARYVVQPIERPVVVRNGDVLAKPQQSPCYEGPLWKSNASAELLAQLECGKYLYHIPFYRQAKRMKAEGFEVSDSTIDGWHQAVCGMLEPLYELQRVRVMRSRLLAADGCPMPVVDNEKRRTVSHYIIEYRSVDTGIPIFLTAPGGGSGRGKKVIEADLSEWTGWALMCDAYSGYDWVGKAGRVLCRCAAHARREFERAMGENPTLATPALALMQDIYAVEAAIKLEGLEGERKTARRRELAMPNWELLKLWCGQHIAEVPKDTLIHKAMGYLLRHYGELTAYVDIAGMPVDNNDTEREIRAMVMGKKSYLFCRTDDACHRAAQMYSMLGACKVLGNVSEMSAEPNLFEPCRMQETSCMQKDAEKWLTYVLKHIGSTKTEDLHRLLPEEWAE